MKAMRYIWIVAMLSVLCGGVQAVTYGKPYQPQYQHRTASFHAQSRADMPIATIGSVNSTMMYSGSALPLAAATGVTTSDDIPSTGSRGPRRAKMEDPFGDETVNDISNPTEPGSPIGDGILPMMLLIGAYCGYVTLRRRKHVKMVSQRETLNG